MNFDVVYKKNGEKPTERTGIVQQKTPVRNLLFTKKTGKKIKYKYTTNPHLLQIPILSRSAAFDTLIPWR